MPTGLVLFGGEGSSVMLEIAKRVTARAQFIFICGQEQKLAERLRRLPTKFPKYVEGFTSEIPYYMHLSDFFIGKPGPGSISEALAMHLPVIVERNAWTLPQERYNTEWIREKEVGVVLQSFREIDNGVADAAGAGSTSLASAPTPRPSRTAPFSRFPICSISYCRKMPAAERKPTSAITSPAQE